MIARENIITQRREKRRVTSIRKIELDLNAIDKASAIKKIAEPSPSNKGRRKSIKIGGSVKRSSISRGFIPTNLLNNLIQEDNLNSRRQSTTAEIELGNRRISILSNHKRLSVISNFKPESTNSDPENPNFESGELKLMTENRLDTPKIGISNY